MSKTYKAYGLPWGDKIGKDVTDCMTSSDVIQKAGLDWTVEKYELVAKMPFSVNANNDINEAMGDFSYGGAIYRNCPNGYATYRTDRNIPLGIVKSKYEVVQNIDAFNFIDNAIGEGKAEFQRAGCFGYGHKVFITAKLPISTTVGGDPIDNYLVFSTSHDGSSGVKILFTPIRIVCENTLNAAIHDSTNYISFRHTKSVHNNLDIAAEILETCNNKIANLQEQFILMKKIKMTDEKAQQTFANVVLTDDEQFRIKQTGHTIGQIITRDWRAINDAQISMKKVNIIAEMNNYYFDGIGQRELLGTGYGVYNAVNGYYSNVDNSEGLKRMDSLLYGDKARKIELAGNLILAA